MMEEIPGEALAAPVEDGPLASRLESKAWKARMEAYEELSKVCQKPVPQPLFRRCV